MAGNRDPYHQDPTGFEFQIRHTRNFLFEAGYLVCPPDGNTKNSAGRANSKSYSANYKFGGAYNSGKFPDPTGNKSSGNYLIYGMASQAVFRSEVGSSVPEFPEPITITAECLTLYRQDVKTVTNVVIRYSDEVREAERCDAVAVES